MNERNQIIILILLTTGLVLVANFASIDVLEPEAVVSDYSAIFYSDNTLEETFTYRINVEGKKFLFRYWEDRLVTGFEPKPHIELIDIKAPSGTIRYVRENRGYVTLLDEASPNIRTRIHSQAYRNEVGAYNPLGYEPGEYTVKYTFKIVPPLEYDDEFSHLNLKLASDHIPYKKVRVAFENPGYIVKSFPHPPTLKKSSDKNLIVFTGESAEDELLEFEFLLTLDAINSLEGVPRRVNGIEKLTIDANKRISTEFLLASGLFWIARLAGFVMPVALYLIWDRVGKEKDFVVPRTLSDIPNKGRAPWIVNLVFKKGVADFDEDGFNATMLDLHIREKIRITTEGKDTTIEILDDRGLDKYEGQVFAFLRRISPEGIVTPYEMDRIAKAGRSSEIGSGDLYNIQSRYKNLTSGTGGEISEEFTVNGRKQLVLPALVAFLLLFSCGLGFNFSIFATSLFMEAGGYSLVPIVQVIIAALFPSTLFGYWKDDNLREKLQWDAFRRHLEDFSQLDRYGPEDINMWGPWLVYGTAMGVGDKVAEAMEMLEVDYAPMRLVPTYNYWFMPIRTASHYRAPGRSGGRGGSFGGGGGGGFGGGGGMGGGGGGVR